MVGRVETMAVTVSMSMPITRSVSGSVGWGAAARRRRCNGSTGNQFRPHPIYPVHV